jgi:hypothetical protein
VFWTILHLLLVSSYIIKTLGNYDDLKEKPLISNAHKSHFSKVTKERMKKREPALSDKSTSYFVAAESQMV